MKQFFILFFYFIVVCSSGCGKKVEKPINDVLVDVPMVLTNEKPDRTEVEDNYNWVVCPTSSKKVGSLFTFTDGNYTYRTNDLKVGQVIYEVIKYPNMTAELQVKPTTQTNQIEFDILDYRFYDKGVLIYKKTLEDVWLYYKTTYNIPAVGDNFKGVYELTGLRECTTYNKEVYLEYTFTDENFETMICRDYSKSSMTFISKNDIGKWFDINYRVDAGLNYSENRTDYYFTVVSIKEY